MQSINNVEVFNWVGGSFVDLKEVSLPNFTMQDIIDLFTKHCPIKESSGLSFYYMIGRLRFDLNNDFEVQFLWKKIPSLLDSHTYIYCESTLQLQLAH